MASSSIPIQRKIIDIKYIENSGTTSFTLTGYNGLNPINSGYVSAVEVPSGYTKIAYGCKVDGDPCVVSVGSCNSNWVFNCKSGTSNSVIATNWAIVVKYG